MRRREVQKGNSVKDRGKEGNQDGVQGTKEARQDKESSAVWEERRHGL